MARPKSDIAPRIVHAARDVFATHSVDLASLRQIARAAGTSIGMIYYYFPTKDDLFHAVVEEVYEQLLANMNEALTSGGTVRDRLVRLYERVGKLGEVERQVVAIVLREVLMSEPRRRWIIERFLRGHVPMVLGLISEGQRDGVIDPARHPALIMVCAAALGVVPQQALPQMPFPGLPRGAELSATLVDILLDGVAPRPS
jgi:AcrR family transcriptional regulator